MFIVNDMPPPLDADVLALSEGMATATIGHLVNSGFMTNDVRPVLAGRTIAGCAVTVAFSGQDSTILHHAVGLLRPGDVLVIDRLGDDRHACIGGGGGVGLAAQISGALGAVVDGPCTDPDELEEIGFPVWSRGISPITTRLQGIAGAMNQTVSCAGAVVNPGDLVVADGNGVVVLPRGAAGEILKAAHAKEARSAANMERIRNGEKLGDCSGASEMVMKKLVAST